jgi:uncharacterized protein YndB with AHSA1/START domain
VAVEATGASVVEREIRIQASPETVFAFLTDPAKMVRWMGNRAVFEPHAGGAYAVDISWGTRVSGEVVEVVPSNRVVFTWGWEREVFPVPPGSSTVEIVLEPEGDGTLLRLTHRDLPRDMTAFHVLGWDHYLGRLATAAGNGDPGRDPMTSTVRALRAIAPTIPRPHLYRLALRRVSGSLRAARAACRARSRAP